jgi:hypothetical protein
VGCVRRRLVRNEGCKAWGDGAARRPRKADQSVAIDTIEREELVLNHRVDADEVAPGKQKRAVITGSQRLSGEKDLDDRLPPGGQTTVIQALVTNLDLTGSSDREHPDIVQVGTARFDRLDECSHRWVVRPHASIDQAQRRQSMTREKRRRRASCECNVDHRLPPVPPQPLMMRRTKHVDLVLTQVVCRYHEADGTRSESPVADGVFKYPAEPRR